MDDADRAIVNIIQSDFPMTPRPFLEIAERVHLSEQDVLSAKGYYDPQAFATLFTDVSDAWFEGRGPDVAERSRGAKARSSERGNPNAKAFGRRGCLSKAHRATRRWSLPER